MPRAARPHAETGCSPRCQRPYDRAHVIRRPDWLPIDALDHVTRLQAGLVSRRAPNDSHDERALTLVPELCAQIGIERLELHAEDANRRCADAGTSVAREHCNGGTDDIDGNREADSLARTLHGLIHTDNAAIEIDQRAARVPRVYRCGRLQQALELAHYAH